MIRLRKRSCFLLCLLSLGLRTRADDRILVPGAKINGAPVRLIFDTGAGAGILVWRTTAERFGLDVTAEPDDPDPNSGRVHVDLSEPSAVTLMGQTFPDLRLGVYDPPKDIPSDFDGVLGWQGGKANILILSGVEKELSFAPQVPPAMAKWPKFSVRPDLPTLEIEAVGSKKKVKTLSIDTGDPDGVSLPPDDWKKWRAAHPHQPVTVEAYFMPGAGLVVTEEAWASKLTIGGLALTDVPIKSANVAQEITAGSSGYAGSLGLAALRRVDLVVDGRHGLAYLHPRRDKPVPYRHNRLGAVFAPVNLESDPLLAHVVPGSPAFKAGIRDGDRLLRIDALDVTHWRTEPGMTQLFHEWWERPAGSQSTLTLRRGGAIFTTHVVLENILGPGLPVAEPTHSTVHDIAVFDLWLKLQPNDAFALGRRAYFKAKNRDYAGAIADYDRVIALNPNDASAFSSRASAKFQNHDYTGAIADYNRTIALDPRNAEAFANRALLEEQNHAYNEAMVDYAHALAVAPNDPGVFYQRAHAEAEQHDYADAIADYGRGLVQNPTDRVAFANRAEVKQCQGDYAGAAADYAKAISLRMKDAPHARLYLALCLRRLQVDDTPAGLETQAGWNDPWLRTVASYMTGAVTEAEFMTQATIGAPGDVAVRRCQACYFVGMAHVLQDDAAGARALFGQCLATGLTDIQEFIFAEAELNRAGPTSTAL